jgi:hypothetical protein
MDIIYFMARYTPFWAIPSFIIASQFSYIYWLKDLKKVTYFLWIICAFCVVSILFYVWAGGSDLTPQMIEKMIRYY